MKPAVSASKNSFNNSDIYFDLKALSVYSCLSVRTLWNYMSDSDNPLPHFRLKKKVLVRRSEFDTWMENYRCDGNALDVMTKEIMNDL
jgi:predicted DNA-binding transcriptional regulator AlpA